jgi:hypothetical protein
MIKIQIKSIVGNILFEYEKENNTIKDTIEQAIKENANLKNANLNNANLKNANLENAYLYNANLYNANLENANLNNAYLYNANLENANLENANLYNANLYNANLYNANLENANLENAYLPLWCKWSFGFINDLIKIGCKEKSIEDWDAWFASTEEYSTKRGTEEFKRIQASYEAAKAYKLTMSKP